VIDEEEKPKKGDAGLDDTKMPLVRKLELVPVIPIDLKTRSRLHS